MVTASGRLHCSEGAAFGGLLTVVQSIVLDGHLIHIPKADAVLSNQFQGLDWVWV